MKTLESVNDLFQKWYSILNQIKSTMFNKNEKNSEDIPFKKDSLNL